MRARIYKDALWGRVTNIPDEKRRIDASLSRASRLNQLLILDFSRRERSGSTINEASVDDPFQRGYLADREDHYPAVHSDSSVKEVHQLFPQILYRIGTGKRRKNAEKRGKTREDFSWQPGAPLSSFAYQVLLPFLVQINIPNKLTSTSPRSASQALCLTWPLLLLFFFGAFFAVRPIFSASLQQPSWPRKT